MRAHPDSQPPVDQDPPPEAVKAAHDAMLRLSDDEPALVAGVDETPAEQPSDHGYDHYDI